MARYEMPHSSLYNLLVEGRYQDDEKNKMGTHPAVFRMRIQSLIPYMRLIGKKEIADLAQEYLAENLTNDVN